MIHRRLSIVGYRLFFFDGAAIAANTASMAAVEMIVALFMMSASC